MDWITASARESFDRLQAKIEADLGSMSAKRRRAFFDRLEDRSEEIFRLAHRLYGWRWDFAWVLEELVLTAARATSDRPKWLRRGDADGAAWLHDGRSIWAMAYIDRFAGTVSELERAEGHLSSLGITHVHLMPPYAVPDGPDDGGYAVSSYRQLRSGLGSIDELGSYIKNQHQLGRGVVLDVVANHTADNHRWAEAAKRGEPPFDEFYLMFDTREEVEEWLPDLRMIFPDAGEPFVWRTDVAGPYGGKWVWSTFFDFQWDLNYQNPQVLIAMLSEMLFLANLGVVALRMDATPFLWKAKGTTCENLPEAHLILKLMASLVAVVAPSIVFLSEAIVHPDEVSAFVRPDECPLGYNPLIMALTWEALATGEVRMLADALANRTGLPPGSQWLTYIRSHDDIGWGFADEDAWRLGIDPGAHRAFLTEFYAGSVADSWARGARFQENPITGDVRISGASASLAGLETAIEAGDGEAIDLAVRRLLAAQTLAFTSVGIPLIFLGDEIGMTNDHRYGEEPTHRTDNRWMHRPRYDWARLAESNLDPTTPTGRLLAGIRRLAKLRTDHAPVFSNDVIEVLETGHPGVLGYRRSADGSELLILISFTREPSEVLAPSALASGEGTWCDVHDLARPIVDEPIELCGYQTALMTRSASHVR